MRNEERGTRKNQPTTVSGALAVNNRPRLEPSTRLREQLGPAATLGVDAAEALDVPLVRAHRRGAARVRRAEPRRRVDREERSHLSRKHDAVYVTCRLSYGSARSESLRRIRREEEEL